MEEPNHPLRVKSVRIERLRNVGRVELVLAEGQNLLVGGNGQGKTTLLEALYLLGAVRSFRGARPMELVQHGAKDAIVRGTIGAKPPDSEIIVALTKQGRQVKVDGKRAELAEHFCRFPIVAFHPGDLELIFGGPGVRRRFLDRMLFQAEPGYPRWFREYRRAIQSRNELLRKNGTEPEIRAYDRVLAAAGAKMSAGRVRLSTLLARAAVEILEGLKIEPFQMRLKANVEPEEKALFAALKQSLAGDRRRGRTSVGPHTDDLELHRPTGMAKVVASRGEARAVTVSLRLAERKVITSCSRAIPMLLLDDVWAELDQERAERVLEMVAAEPGQVVVTGTGGSEPRAVSGWQRFEVIQGQVVSVNREITKLV